MHLIVSYDIVDDYRRLRVSKFLRGYLDRVQKSVFEGRIAERRFEALRQGLAKRVDRKDDSVRIWHVCERCTGMMEVIGTGSYVGDNSEDILV